MAKSRLLLIVDTNLPLGTLQDELNDSLPTRQRELDVKIVDFFRGLLSGAKSGLVKSGVVSELFDATPATQTVTFSGAATAGDTVTINGVILTAVSNVTTPTNNQWRVGTSASTAAANLAAAINASTSPGTCGAVTALAVGAVVTVSAAIDGVIGNSILISKSSTAITLGGSSLVNGSGRLPVLTTFHYGK